MRHARRSLPLTCIGGAARRSPTKSLTPETALKAAQAALAKCRAEGFQVAVAVVDRAGITQVLLRDRFAGPHTVEVATNKAWTAASFRTNTDALEKASRPEQVRCRAFATSRASRRSAAA